MCCCTFFTCGRSDALVYAEKSLRQHFRFLSALSSEVTHVLLPVPSFTHGDFIKGGSSLQELALPKTITLVGGNLQAARELGYSVIDLLEDSLYLAENAKITAYCSIGLALSNVPSTPDQWSVLILGWGRIGKCLARLLICLGARVTICARKEQDRAICKALGYAVRDFSGIDSSAYQIIFNTVPAPMLTCREADTLKIDLASVPGILGTDVIYARGLPGKSAPESSGNLIARTVSRILLGKDA